MNYLLYPFSLLYGFGASVRNKLFDWNVLKSVAFDIPIIVIGNIRVGGTGKTPHTEWILNKLGAEYKLGVLSRGYGRNSKGFRWVQTNSKVTEVGDEPLQIKNKFPDVPVAVCEDRVVAIPEMLASFELDAIILDDAFQHRYIKPSFAIVLSDSNHPVFKDHLLPAGRLRESAKGINRSQALIFSKSNHLTSEQKNEFIRIIRGQFNTQLPVYFSTYQYGSPIGVQHTLPFIEQTPVITVTGIAEPATFNDYVNNRFRVMRSFRYSDHYPFNEKDIQEWEVAIRAHPGAVILTTEKDAMRINRFSLNEFLPVYYLPIRVTLDPEDTLVNAIKDCIQYH